MIEEQVLAVAKRVRAVPRVYLGWLTPLLLLIAQGAQAQAQPYVYERMLATFGIFDVSGVRNSNGLFPNGELLQTADGSFYGVAREGGTNGTGTVFTYKTGGAITAIYNFSAVQGTFNTNADGANPMAGLVLGADGLLYGTTSGGGANGTGTVFSISTGGVLTTLYSFSAWAGGGPNTDGVGPLGKLVQLADGSFRGTTVSGGAGGTGTIFSITPAGAFTSLYAFPAMDSNNVNATGAQPHAGLVLASDGNLYGTAELGGANGTGTLFKVTPQGTFTLLYTFSSWITGSNSDGAHPLTALMQASDGYLYGTTAAAGTAYGTIFRLDTSGNFTTLYNFDTIPNGGFYIGQVVVDAAGGAAGPLLEGSDGNLYGAGGGGILHYGEIFSISPTTGSYSNLFAFGDFPTDGIGLSSGLIRGLDGQLYGVTADNVADTPDLGVGTIYTLITSTTAPISMTLSPSTVRAPSPFTQSWSAPGARYCDPVTSAEGVSGEAGTLPATGSGMFVSGPGLLPVGMWCRFPQGDALTYGIETVLPALPTVTISVSPSTITLASSATLTWGASDATACAASGAWSGAPTFPDSKSVTPSTTGVSMYTLTCTGPGGSSAASASLTVTAATVPKITFSVSPSETTVGVGAPQLSWSTTSAQACTASGAWTGPEPTNGNTMLNGLSAGDYSYTLTCTGPAGTASASASLKVDPASGSGNGGGGGGGAMSFLTVLELAGFALLRLITVARRLRANSRTPGFT